MGNYCFNLIIVEVSDLPWLSGRYISNILVLLVRVFLYRHILRNEEVSNVLIHWQGLLLHSIAIRIPEDYTASW